MSYDEHLISMASGDGDNNTCPSECAENSHPGAEHGDEVTDRLARIQKSNAMWLQSAASDRTDRDIEFLLAMVLEQRAQIAGAKAEALEEAADKVMGPSDVLLDGATCRWIAMEMRERAAELRKS